MSNLRHRDTHQAAGRDPQSNLPAGHCHSRTHPRLHALSHLWYGALFTHISRLQRARHRTDLQAASLGVIANLPRRELGRPV